MYKKGIIMKIAVTYDNGKVFGHFGHTENFKLYDTEDGKIKAMVVVPTNGSGHGALAGFLSTALKSSFAAESEREHRRH